MTRKLSLALTLAALLLPAGASARAVPDAKLHCTHCMTKVVAGGADSYRRMPGARASQVTPVRSGAAQPNRRSLQAAPAVGTGTMVANPSAPCSSPCARDCDHSHHA
jgi:hypothetical protein